MEFIARSRAVSTRWLPLAAMIAGGAGCALVLRRVNPYAAHSPLPHCPFHALTGLYCPGCGSTRALYWLVHGDVAHALALNPLLVIALPFVLLMTLHIAGWRPRALDPLMRILGNPKVWLFVLIGFGVLRNLPFAPFSALAPGR